jgi:hypothetical protein
MVNSHVVDAEPGTHDRGDIGVFGAPADHDSIDAVREGFQVVV